MRENMKTCQYKDIDYTFTGTEDIRLSAYRVGLSLTVSEDFVESEVLLIDSQWGLELPYSRQMRGIKGFIMAFRPISSNKAMQADASGAADF